MVGDKGLPNDAVYSVSSLILTVIWHLFVLGGIIAVLSLLLLSRERIVDVARTDRAVQEFDAFPVNFSPWGFFVANHEVTTTRWTLSQRAESTDGDVVVSSFGAQVGKIQPLFDKLSAYWSLAWPRLVILAGFAPALLAMAWAAWGYGRYLNALSQADGKPLSTLSYKYWKMGLGTCSSLYCSFPFWPFPLSSWVLLVPIAALMVCVVYTRRWRA